MGVWPGPERDQAFIVRGLDACAVMLHCSFGLLRQVNIGSFVGSWISLVQDEWAVWRVAYVFLQWHVVFGPAD